MNRRQRIILALVMTLVGPIHIAIMLALDTLTGGIIWDFFMLLPSSIIVAVGVYFLSFVIWDNAEHEAAEDGRPRTGSIVNRRQRILFTTLITFVFPVNIFLAIGLTVGLEILTGMPLWNGWILIPISILLAVGVYFLSFIIWDKAEQEAGEGQVIME